jgi:hypothetical protein
VATNIILIVGFVVVLLFVQYKFKNLKEFYMSSIPDPLAQALADLNAAVTNEGTVEASIVTLLQGLAAQIGAVSTDPAAIEAIVAQINTNAATMAAAVTANTPAPAPVSTSASSGAVGAAGVSAAQVKAASKFPA